jgi:peptidoglycan/LPS O-acetylase OafA/YrhL
VTVVGAMHPANESTSPAPLHIPSLDGLRALSFLVVFLGHAVPAGWTQLFPPRFGVTVFFFLSGYLITTLMRIELDVSASLNYRGFYLRRVLRILPPFYLSYIAAVALAELGVLDGDPTPRAIAAVALHLANYWEIFHGLAEIPAGTSVYWSLAVEEHFYLFFPLLYVWLRRALPARRGQLAALLALCALVLAWRLVLLYGLRADPLYLMQATDCRIDSILFGCALAIYGNPIIDPTRFSERIWKAALLPAALVALLSSTLIRDPFMNLGLRTTIQGVALMAVFSVAIRYHEWSPCRLLNLKPLAFIGTLSYTLYLVHFSVLKALSKHGGLGWTLRLLVGFALSLAIAYAMYLLVERPCARLRRRLHEARRPVAQLRSPPADRHSSAA